MEGGCGPDGAGGRSPFHSALSEAGVEGSQALEMPADRLSIPHFGGKPDLMGNLAGLAASHTLTKDIRSASQGAVTKKSEAPAKAAVDKSSQDADGRLGETVDVLSSDTEGYGCERWHRHEAHGSGKAGSETAV